MLPADLDMPRAAAINFIFLCWGLYAPILSVIGKGTLNSQLHVVRQRWMGMLQQSPRENRVFDAVMLGHITNSIAFFGSATLIVLATLVGTLFNARALHLVALEHKFLGEMSLGLFALYLATVTAILAGCFFSFVYALRKLAYTLAMIGGLKDAPGDDENSGIMIGAPATAGLMIFKDRLGAERSTLTYVRYPAPASVPTAESSHVHLTKRVLASLPDRLLIATGRFLYRHIG